MCAAHLDCVIQAATRGKERVIADSVSEGGTYVIATAHAQAPMTVLLSLRLPLAADYASEWRCCNPGDDAFNAKHCSEHMYLPQHCCPLELKQNQLVAGSSDHLGV